MQMLWRYLCENFRYSFRIWERHEAFAVLIGAGIAAILAIVSLHGIEIIFNTKFDKYYFPAFIFLWFLVIVLVVTPFRMWRDDQYKFNALIAKTHPLKDADPDKFNAESYFIYEIEFLWYGKEPPNIHVFRNFATREMGNLWNALHTAIANFELHAEETHAAQKLNIAELHDWAHARNLKSKFLFGDDETTDV